MLTLLAGPYAERLSPLFENCGSRDCVTIFLSLFDNKKNYNGTLNNIIGSIENGKQPKLKGWRAISGSTLLG